MLKRALCFACALMVCASSVFAVDGVSNDVYALEAVEASSLLDSGISLMSATSWDTSDASHLTDIRNALVAGYSNATSNSVLGYLGTLANRNYTTILNSILSAVQSINTGSSYSWSLTDSNNLSNIWSAFLNSPGSYSGGSIFGLLNSIRDAMIPNASTNFALQGGYGTNQLLSMISDYSRSQLTSIQDGNSALSSLLYFYYTGGVPLFINNDSEPATYVTIPYLFGVLVSSFLYDGLGFWNGGDYTLFHYIKDSDLAVRQLQKVLASDDDLALVEAQKQNRDEIENSFLSGSSGGTSLGAGDFGNLSNIGSTVKDSISLNGQASISSFTGGLSSADESGQGWFSAETRSSLDAVTNYNSRSRSAYEEEYNMTGFSDHYSWLWGDAD